MVQCGLASDMTVCNLASGNFGVYYIPTIKKTDKNCKKNATM